MITTVTAKGQVLIPAALRRKFGIKPGTKVRFYEEGGRIVLQLITEDAIDRACGMLKGSGALQILMEERRQESEE